MNKLGLAESPCCECGSARQTVEHLVMDCPMQEENRDLMICDIETSYIKHQIPVWQRTFDMKTLLAPTHTCPQVRRTVQSAIVNFLHCANLDL